MDAENVKWSADGEGFIYDSLDELLENGYIEVGKTVYFGEAVKPDTDWVDADDVIELIGERAYDVGGEYAEDFPTLSAEAKSELAEFLSAWQDKHCAPTFWTIPKHQEYTVTADDIARAQP